MGRGGLLLSLPTSETHWANRTKMHSEETNEVQHGGQDLPGGLGSVCLQPINRREATAEHIATIFELIEYQAFGRDGSGTLLTISSSTIGKTIQEGGLLVAEAGTVLAGCASIVEYSGIAEIRSLVVVPKFRGQGIARLLIHSHLKKAAANGHAKVYALTNGEPMAVFLTLGFSSSGRPPQKLINDRRCCPLNSGSLCEEISVALDLRNPVL